MLIALVLTLGVLVSCEPDPDPDELAGTWTYTSGGMTTTINADGYGSYTVSRTFSGMEIYRETGTYTLADGYVTLKGSIPSQFTSSNPEYVFVAEPSVDEYYIALDDDSSDHDYPSSDYEGPFTFTGGNTFTMDTSETVLGITFKESEVYTLQTSSLTFSGTMSYKDGTTLLYSQDVAGSATKVDLGTTYPKPCMYFYNDTYSNYTTKAKYHVSGSTLSIYVGPEEVNFTK